MKRGTLPLTALRALEATLRHGQMTLAAEELGVTYGAVSRQVRGLEALLGVALFDGPRNRLVPSQAALDMQPALQAAFDGIEEAVARAMQRERRLLDVSCLGTFTMRWLIPRLFGFQKRHPAIEVRLTADDGPVDFARQRLDAAIRVGTGRWGAAEVTRLFADEVGPVLSPALLPGGAPAGWEALSALPVLHTATRRDAWTGWARQAGVPAPAGGQEFEHFYFLLEAAVAGLGMAIAPLVLVRDDLAAGRLVAPMGFCPSGQDYVALTPPRPGREAALFVRWLQDQSGADALAGGRSPPV
ncbi:LysR substrate-binding domain-containing protein [Poseidonocella sp. HB161398]|uniref:LysR substrate-binding domain-containing protein n=1 Tax=Poseidonocella sp. HB161398 TaxID=2320855 RepID=UPI00110891C0|nr:LysR substrate-binding domain-containing protein [Poseidonocella sp. HB161398]